MRGSISDGRLVPQTVVAGSQNTAQLHLQMPVEEPTTASTSDIADPSHGHCSLPTVVASGQKSTTASPPPKSEIVAPNPVPTLEWNRERVEGVCRLLPHIAGNRLLPYIRGQGSIFERLLRWWLLVVWRTTDIKHVAKEVLMNLARADAAVAVAISRGQTIGPHVSFSLATALAPAPIVIRSVKVPPPAPAVRAVFRARQTRTTDEARAFAAFDTARLLASVRTGRKPAALWPPAGSRGHRPAGSFSAERCLITDDRIDHRSGEWVAGDMEN